MSKAMTLALSLVESGYQVIPIAPGKKNPALDDWRSYEADATQIRAWWNWLPNANIGINTTRTPAIDLDILDDELAREMEAFVTTLLGDAPTRVGRAPKRLLVFSAANPFRKIASPFFVSPDGSKHRVEVLGEGQQFVAYGRHPDTKQPYRWISFEELRDLDVADLPVLTAELAQQVVDEFARRAEARGWERKGLGRAAATGDDNFDFLRPKVQVDTGKLKAALEYMPGNGDYETWLQVGMALHAHFEGEDEGFDLWNEWSADADNYAPDALAAKWRSFGHYTGRPITPAFILKHGREAREKAQVQEELDQVGAFEDAIENAVSLDDLMRNVVSNIADAQLEDYHRDKLVTLIQNKAKVFDTKLPLKTIRDRLQGYNDKDGPMDLTLEIDLAKQVLSEHYAEGRHLKFFSEIFWEYRGGVWLKAEKTGIQKRAMDTMMRLQAAGDEGLAKLSERMAESRGDRMNALTQTVGSVIEKLVAEEGSDDPLDLLSKRSQMVVNCANAELWFDQDGSMHVRRHDADHRLTTQVNCLYNPKAECPTWDAAIRRVFQDCEDVEAVIRHFEEVFGYILQPTRHQAIWVMLKGPGGNGKSFLLDVISNVIGHRSITATSIAELSGRTSNHFTDSLQGKLMLLDDDLKAGTMLPDGWLKKLSEAKLLSADPKFGQAYTFTARCVPVMLTNKWPSTVDLSEGIRRRAVVFESNHILTADEKNPLHLQQIIDKELPGVLNRLIAGFRRFLERGQTFEPPKQVAHSLQRWAVQSNATVRFVSEVLVPTDNCHDHLTATQLYDAYRNWIRFHEVNAKPLGRNTFYQALESLGVERKNHSGRQVYSGFRLARAEGVEDVFDALDDVDRDEGL